MAVVIYDLCRIDLIPINLKYSLNWFDSQDNPITRQFILMEMIHTLIIDWTLLVLIYHTQYIISTYLGSKCTKHIYLVRKYKIQMLKRNLFSSNYSFERCQLIFCPLLNYILLAIFLWWNSFHHHYNTIMNKSNTLFIVPYSRIKKKATQKACYIIRKITIRIQPL